MGMPGENNSNNTNEEKSKAVKGSLVRSQPGLAYIQLMTSQLNKQDKLLQEKDINESKFQELSLKYDVSQQEKNQLLQEGLEKYQQALAQLEEMVSQLEEKDNVIASARREIQGLKELLVESSSKIKNFRKDYILKPSATIEFNQPSQENEAFKMQSELQDGVQEIVLNAEVEHDLSVASAVTNENNNILNEQLQRENEDLQLQIATLQSQISELQQQLDSRPTQENFDKLAQSNLDLKKDLEQVTQKQLQASLRSEGKSGQLQFDEQTITNLENNLKFQRALRESVNKCIDRLSNYVESYKDYTKNVTTFWHKHTQKGRVRADDHFKNWQNAQRVELVSLLEEKLKVLNNKEDNVSAMRRIFGEVIKKLEENASRDLKNIKGGNWHDHSYRAYLLGFVREMTTAQNVDLILKADFSLSFGPIQKATLEQLNYVKSLKH